MAAGLHGVKEQLGNAVSSGSRTALAAFLAIVALAVVPVARADLGDETALAKRFAPVVRLVEQPDECGPGEPYEPIDVNLLFGDPGVALRGPWNPTDLVKIGPGAGDLVGLDGYHLDFPGNALEPGCDYEKWGRGLTAGSAPTVYGHVATDPGHPGQLALQYWLFYVFNDFNNLHEGDWEMIQLVFEAADAGEALAENPVSVGYTSHEGAERADWGDDKLEIVGGTHPVVYPAAGSHANKFTAALYLASSADAGVGCDDTRGPHRELRPLVKTIPSDAVAGEAAFPWIAFEGRWGELQKAFFNGPTGPNLKQQWLEPIEWSDGWRDRSYAVPVGGAFAPTATGFFCEAVAHGSRGLVQLLLNPGAVVLAILVLLGLLWFAVTRTTWRPSAPFRVARRRAWGQVLTAAGRMYVRRAPLFLGIGLLFIPLSIVISVLQALVLGGAGLAGVEVTGESAGLLVLLVAAVGAALTLLGLAFVQAATAYALVQLDEGSSVGTVQAYRVALTRTRPLLGSLALATAVWMVLTASVVLLPVAIWLAVRWSLLAQVVELEGRSALGALRRSAELARGRWLWLASLVGAAVGFALVLGPFLGALLIVLTDAPLLVLNLFAAVVYALSMPFVALTTSYAYFNARTHFELDRVDEPDELPAEIQLSG